MISLILPYWQRQGATDRSLELMARHYRELHMEVIVVDDGSPTPYAPPSGTPFPVRVIRLPAKTRPLDPCVPINVGASAANGDFIALSNPEILHEQPVLPAMLEECVRGGPLAYVMAACWNPEKGRWHSHSSFKRPDTGDVGSWLPEGAQYHFMTMMSRYLWDATGGFDEAYREGAGYDDPDFVRRLHAAGAKFIMRDDLVVQHPRQGAHAPWTPDMFDRNRKVFLSKWQPLR